MGFFIYSLIEILNRGYTHWTMALTGGMVLMTLYEINRKSAMTLVKSCFIGALFITSTEFSVGIVVNKIFQWNVWDYSEVPLNVMGQICLPFTFLWFMLCIPAYFLCRFIHNRLRAECFS
ncbi:MAG: putative ABC transporter permease [Oscillospiraceae bacterium]|nr:putative ABC transporter permease [Oscillospiraceae bacterium]